MHAQEPPNDAISHASGLWPVVLDRGEEQYISMRDAKYAVVNLDDVLSGQQNWPGIVVTPIRVAEAVAKASEDGSRPVELVSGNKDTMRTIVGSELFRVAFEVSPYKVRSEISNGAIYFNLEKRE